MSVSGVTFMDAEDVIALLEDMSSNPYGIDLDRLAAVLISFQAAKDAAYGGSWAKRGELGVFINMMRSSDRLARLVPRAVAGEEAACVELVDSLVDQVCYGLMWLSLIGKIRPGSIELWLRRAYCTATGSDYESTLALLFGIDR